MTSLERRGNAIAFAFTAFFFLAFLIFSLAVKFKPQEKFQVLTINLASFPVEKKSLQETTLQKKDVPSKNQSSKDVEKIKPVEPKKIPEEKSSSQKNKIVKNGLPVSSEKQKTFEEPKIKKSVEQLMAENNSYAKKTAEWNESFFDDSQTVQSKNISEAQNKSSVKSSVEGTAAKSSAEKTSGVSSSSESARSGNADVSEETKSSLANIKNTFSSSVSGNIKSKTSVASQNSGGKLSIKMSDGKSRELLYPKNPVIFISEENAKLVDETKKVIVRFKVRADGTVPVTGISILPSSLLPLQIQAEIKEQIQLWRFSEESSGLDGTASFDYTLEIR
ncbi:hypothetical protein [Treponema succinifaciens]|uniref:Uncharacterized protein n=1 Tax=Treponema succinifaciens (strain ATCC 33096 / DSM 2489 / 6091) TaxID=869209 RepID=F2NXY4_TRES6|nr:hypothetical protein [Treponema succinifaciens]AEB13454.1 hypothetical protein Tresu_0505 [Treponema succinifaciens DSM 2489]